MVVRVTEKLEPCPFCGGQAELVHMRSGDDIVRCTSCRARTRQYHENENGPIAAWNRRDGSIEHARAPFSGECRYIPDERGFTWYDENDAEHCEGDSAADDCGSASCDKCGFAMLVGDGGWFQGWDDVEAWHDEKGAEHHGYVLKAEFRYCPNCGRMVVE